MITNENLVVDNRATTRPSFLLIPFFPSFHHPKTNQDVGISSQPSFFPKHNRWRGRPRTHGAYNLTIDGRWHARCEQSANCGIYKTRFGKEYALNKLGVHVGSEELLALRGQSAIIKVSKTFKAASARDAIAGTPYLIDDSLAVMMLAGTNAREAYGDRHMTLMI